MTIKEATAHVIKTLKDIRVPMAEIQNIGVPISQCIGILTQCVEYMEQADQAEAQKEGEADAE